MNIKANTISLFDNLSQFNYSDDIIDFHNDFNCIQIQFHNSKLSLLFERIIDKTLIEMKFIDVKITTMNLKYDILHKIGYLTIDNVYRGRFEKNGKLHEYSIDGLSYFYLDFYEDISIEFYCNEFEINKINTP